MGKNLLCLVVVAILLAGCGSAQKSGSAACDKAKVLRHVVLLKFKDGATAEQVKEVEDAFVALPGKIDAISDLEWGTDASVEGLAQGFTHCFFVTFKSEEARAKYLPHPEHKAFGKILGPRLDKVLVIDYWTK